MSREKVNRRVGRISLLRRYVNDRKEKKECEGEGIGDKGVRSVGWAWNPKEL